MAEQTVARAGFQRRENVRRTKGLEMKHRESILRAMAWVFAFSAHTGYVQAVSAEAKMAKEEVVTFCTGPNLFIDDYLIAESCGLRRTTHQPVKLPVFGGYIEKMIVDRYFVML